MLYIKKTKTKKKVTGNCEGYVSGPERDREDRIYLVDTSMMRRVSLFCYTQYINH